MARTFLTSLDLAQNELQNAVVQNLAAAPSNPAPKKSQLYFNSVDSTLYWYDGSAWQSAKGGAVTFPGFGAVLGESVFGVGPANGSANSAARSDHQHGNPSLGTTSTTAAAGNHGHVLTGTEITGSLPTSKGGTNNTGVYNSGAIVYASNALTLAGTATGSAGQMLLSGGTGTPTWSNHDGAAHSGISLSVFAAPTADVSLGSFKITNLGTPAAATDAANKQYVDNTAQGLDAKLSVRMATTANSARSGLAAVDGVTPLAGDRVLVKNQTTPAENGLFNAASGAWTRTTDADAWAELVAAFVFVEEGTTQADTGWVCTVDATGTINTTPILWTQFSGAGSFIAGTGMTQSGTTFNVIAADASLTIGADSMNVAFGGSGGDNGSAVSSARSDHKHDILYPPATRTIATTAPLTGGGDLSANRTLGIINFTSGAAGAVPASGGGSTTFLRADGAWAIPPAPLDTTAGDARYGRKFSINVGGAVTAGVAHNLNTRDVEVQVYRNSSPYDTVECDAERTDVNNVTLRFAIAPASNAYRCVVIG